MLLYTIMLTGCEDFCQILCQYSILYVVKLDPVAKVIKYSIVLKLCEAYVAPSTKACTLLRHSIDKRRDKTTSIACSCLTNILYLGNTDKKLLITNVTIENPRITTITFSQKSCVPKIISNGGASAEGDRLTLYIKFQCVLEMVCKEDVVSWFKELESYKRIDAMCTLLNMCLPFELRFIGTYLEELGKRDFQELRGAELRANNPTDLAADIGGANTDSRTRRKMALYVSLLRSCNFACATTLYNAMVSLEQSGLLKGLYGDLLEEILLLYTMALHHPAFTFDQKSHFGEILDKLKVEDQRLQYQDQQEHINVVPVSACHTQSSITQNMSVPPPNLTNLGPPPGLMYVKTSGVQPPSTDSVPQELNSPPVLSGTGSVVPMLAEVPHPPPGLPLPQYNMGEYMGQHGWPANIIVSTLSQPLEVINYSTGPPAPTSPLVSSPGDSRAASPRARRRLSRDRSPPLPPVVPPEHPPLAHMTANFENMSVEMRHTISDERLREITAAHHYRSLEKLNGVRRRGAYCPPARSSSDSGSSAASSPPGTPAPPQRRITPSAPPPVSFLPYHRPYAYPPAPPAYRPPPPPFANGEPPPYPAPAPYGGFVPVLYAPAKLSCYNCGAAGHAGHECKEPSMEEMTRAGGYQLDFGGAPPEQTEK